MIGSGLPTFVSLDNGRICGLRSSVFQSPEMRANDCRDSSLVNVSSVPNLFLSEPAIWEYGYGVGEPSIPTTVGDTAKIGVYEPADNANGMVFPIHKACLDILQRLCQIRQAQNQAPGSASPRTLDGVCDALQQQRRKNFTKPDKPMSEDYYYANSGGIEWPHGYYGARQFWADEWNTEPGWEVRTIQRPANTISADFLFVSTCAPTLRQIEYPIYTPTFSASSPSHPPHSQHPHPLPTKSQIVLAGCSLRRRRQ